MRLRQISLFIFLAFVTAVPANAATDEERQVSDATDVVDQFLRIPEQAVPAALLSRAYAVAVIPHVIKVGFGIGARRGKGVLVVRQEDGSWSNPAFIGLTGGSLGFQIGAQSTDVILVFKTRKSVDGIANGKLTLGADASIAAGPIGRHTEVATDLSFRSEVYAYARSRGIFAGVALEGGGLSMDRKANAAFYGSASITPEQIFAGSGNAAPRVANDFVQLLTAQTSRLPMRPGSTGSGPTNARSQQPQQRESEVRTYGMNQPEEYE